MKIGDKHFNSIWPDPSNPSRIFVIDQAKLPFEFSVVALESVEDVYNAISKMTVRGAPLIGAAAAYGIYLATLEVSSLTKASDLLQNAARWLISSRPTAVNLEWAVKRMLARLSGISDRAELSLAAFDEAHEI